MLQKHFLKEWLIGLIFCFAQWCEAKVELPTLISDGLVLQREQNIKVWGYANPGEEVKINFLKKKYQTNADATGNWQVILSPAKAGGPYAMQINELEIKDILIGDVWLCSGQSNMELTVSRVTDMFREEVEAYTNPMIRYVKVPLAYNFHQPQTDIAPASWKTLTQENVMSFSAVAYFFAKDLYAKTKVPIGLINSSVGGSPAEAWISEESLRPFSGYINEKSLYQSDDYVAGVKNIEQKKRELWNSTLHKQDAGLNDLQKWYDLEYNDSSWEHTDLFHAAWGSNGLNPVNGSFWFRKDFEIPPSLSGEKAVLRMGCIVDADSIYVNGVFVGTTSYQYPPRIYPIPENLLKEGKNTITVRLISYMGYPEFVKDKPYKIVFGDKNKEISLEGKWKYKQGTTMPVLEGKTPFHYKPAGLYNAMIAPLKNCALKGIIWYQGEANTKRYNEYYSLLSTLIEDWRSCWQQPGLPFFAVQLANFMQAFNQPTESQWAELRDVQLQITQTVPNTGLAVAIDLGEWNDIHPLNKKEVGRRLSLLAQNQVYGNKKMVCNGPVYHSKTTDGNKIILSFEEGTDDLEQTSNLQGFSIAGPDGKFHWAKGCTDKNKVIVWCNDVQQPVTVRYAWADNPAGANLKNKAGLPASPFRTDK
jgi:sialate O-acetylesterase